MTWRLLEGSQGISEQLGEKKNVEEYTKMETQADEIVQRTQREHWGINENVHYKRWKDFTRENFIPIVEAFQDLEDLFRCTNCQGILSLSMKQETPSNVTCPTPPDGGEDQGDFSLISAPVNTSSSTELIEVTRIL